MLRTVVAAACTLAVLAVPANAATINWGAAQGITGDSDVSTTGTLVGAFNVAGAATTINTVDFQAFAVGNVSNTVGNFNLSVPGFFLISGSGNSVVAPFGSLSAAYRSMLSTFGASISGAITLTMSNLTVGRTYQFQAWVNDSRSQDPPGFTFQVDVSAGNTATLDPNTSIVEGGLGQFVVGSFVADAATQQVEFLNGEVGIVNGFQLRDLGALPNGNPPAVPLPPAVWAGLALGAAVIARRRFRRP